MATLLARPELNALNRPCGEEHCDPASHVINIKMDCGCEAGLCLKYELASGTLELSCFECGKQGSRILVAPHIVQ